MRAYEKNTSAPVFEATRFLYSSICYTKVTVVLGAPNLMQAICRVLSEVCCADTRKNEIRLFHMVVQVGMTEDYFLCFFIEGSS